MTTSWVRSALTLIQSRLRTPRPVAAVTPLGHHALHADVGGQGHDATRGFVHEGGGDRPARPGQPEPLQSGPALVVGQLEEGVAVVVQEVEEHDAHRVAGRRPA